MHDHAYAHDLQVLNACVTPGCYTKDSKFSKWSPNWDGPYRMKRCVSGNAYILEMLEGKKSSTEQSMGNF
jgi:hypothetical protein